ncbi:MAG: hypothetical protein WD342_08620 [Verrucomicrobiales bacterium]
MKSNARQGEAQGVRKHGRTRVAEGIEKMEGETFKIRLLTPRSRNAMRKMAIFLLVVPSCMQVMADDAQEVSQRYSVTSSSTYQQLSAAFQQATADFRADTTDGTGMLALDVIYGWIPLNNRIELSYSYFMQQPETPFYLAGVEGIADALKQGATASAQLKQDVSNSIWQKLGTLQTTEEVDKELANEGVIALLLLNDDRGLEAILTGTKYIENLQTVDSWNKDSPETKFTDLVTQYTALIGQKAGARERVALYELARLRKAGGATEIVSTNSVIDLSKF